jgi:hypothetical protein
MTIYNVMTNDNWTMALEIGIEESSLLVACVYYFSMWIILNMCMIGLVIGVLLDGFTKQISHHQDNFEENNHHHIEHDSKN